LPENFGIGGAVGRWCDADGVTVERDRRNVDDRTFGESLFQIVVFRVACCEAQPPAVVVEHDAHVVRVI
jgi:hypothetical protein